MGTENENAVARFKTLNGRGGRSKRKRERERERERD